jgi:hypothetical protein
MIFSLIQAWLLFDLLFCLTLPADMPKQQRIIKSESLLSQFLRPGEDFYIGILWEDYLKNVDLQKYGLPTTFVNGQEMVPKAKGGATKANKSGKFKRKQPEEKTTRTIEISFINKHGTHVHYFRDFDVYVRELVHQFDMKFICRVNEHDQKIVASPVLTYTDQSDTNLMNTHAINLFGEVFGEFEIFDANLNPALKFNKRYSYDFLPKGELNKGENTKDVLLTVERYLKDPVESAAFAKRLFVIKEFDPDLRGRGPGGFFGYIVFGFSSKQIVILESMYHGRATYVFDAKNYEEIIIKDKQEIIQNKLMKERFIHNDKWESTIRAYLQSL